MRHLFLRKDTDRINHHFRYQLPVKTHLSVCLSIQWINVQRVLQDNNCSFTVLLYDK